jgi:hypothetical protein
MGSTVIAQTALDNIKKEDLDEIFDGWMEEERQTDMLLEYMDKTPLPAPEPKFFISIDPGLVNLAAVAGTYTVDLSKKHIFIKVYKDRITNDRIIGGKEALDVLDLKRRLKSWFHQKVDSVKEAPTAGSLALIERQIVKPPLSMVTLKLFLIEGILMTILSENGMFVDLVNSSQYKQDTQYCHWRPRYKQDRSHEALSPPGGP